MNTHAVIGASSGMDKGHLSKDIKIRLENAYRIKDLNPILKVIKDPESQMKSNMEKLTEVYNALKESGLFDEIKNGG